MSLFLKRWAGLYAHQTAAEQALEPAVASLGVRYRTQHPMFAIGAILDFALPDFKVCLEVDGSSHRRPAQQDRDQARTAQLEALGWVVVRCVNEDALANPRATLARMLRQLPPLVLGNLLAQAASPWPTALAVASSVPPESESPAADTAPTEPPPTPRAASPRSARSRRSPRRRDK